VTLARGPLIALPPNPGEVTEAGAPLIWAWLLETRSSGIANKLNSATEAGIERRTNPSYSNSEVMESP
jgi:hypothetical protein